MTQLPGGPSFNRGFHLVALVIVAIGATIGIAASLAAWAIHGAFSTTTFLASLFAITSAAPVLRDYREMRRRAA